MRVIKSKQNSWRKLAREMDFAWFSSSFVVMMMMTSIKNTVVIFLLLYKTYLFLFVGRDKAAKSWLK